MHARRGQALVETVIALPLFLLMMFGMYWAVQSSVLAERVQLGVRYAGLIGSKSQPYVDYSLYTVYGNLNGASHTATTPTCFAPTGDVFTGTGPYLDPSGAGTAKFWQPVTNSPAGSCNGPTDPTLVAIVDPNMTKTALLLHDDTALTATLNVPNYLSGALGSTTKFAAAQNFFRSADLGDMIHCYAPVSAAVSASLTPANDTTSPIAAPTPLPPIPDQTVLAPVASCATSGTGP